MAKYIDAEALIEELEAGGMPIYWSGISGILGDKDCIRDYIERAPAADVRPERHGHWILNTDSFTLAKTCSECNYNKPCIASDMPGASEPENYCPNCGAKMDGNEDNHNE